MAVGVGVTIGVAVGVGVPVGVGVGDGVAVAVAVGVGVCIGVGVGSPHGTAPTKLPNGLGSFPTATVATTVLVEVSMTETLLLRALDT